jgi:hypothetical protein
MHGLLHNFWSHHQWVSPIFLTHSHENACKGVLLQFVFQADNYSMKVLGGRGKVDDILEKVIAVSFNGLKNYSCPFLSRLRNEDRLMKFVDSFVYKALDLLRDIIILDFLGFLFQ